LGGAFGRHAHPPLGKNGDNINLAVIQSNIPAGVRHPQGPERGLVEEFTHPHALVGGKGDVFEDGREDEIEAFRDAAGEEFGLSGQEGVLEDEVCAWVCVFAWVWDDEKGFGRCRVARGRGGRWGTGMGGNGQGKSMAAKYI